MQYTVEALLGGSPVSQWYTAAKGHWTQVLANIDANDPAAVAKVASAEQHWFEHNCGGRWVGQEVMVVAGIGRYYTTANGFDENVEKAKAMYRGLIASTCSVEVHSHAREVSKLYDLVEADA